MNIGDSMNLIDVINDLSEHMHGEHWGINGIVIMPDMRVYQKQPTEMKSLPVEYVDQRGSEEFCGYHGTILFPLYGYSDGDGGHPYLSVWFG